MRMMGIQKMKIVDLRKKVKKMCPACSHHFISCIKYQDIYYDKDKMVVALKRTFQIELYIAKNINNGITIDNRWNLEYNKYKVVDGAELSDEQIKVCEYLPQQCQHIEWFCRIWQDILYKGRSQYAER